MLTGWKQSSYNNYFLHNIWRTILFKIYILDFYGSLNVSLRNLNSMVLIIMLIIKKNYTHKQFTLLYLFRKKSRVRSCSEIHQNLNWRTFSDSPFSWKWRLYANVVINVMIESSEIYLVIGARFLCILPSFILSKIAIILSADV